MTDHLEQDSWKRMSFKGNKVWVQIDPEKNPLIKSGKVRIKYNLKQDYDYWIKLDSLAPESSAVPATKTKVSSKKIGRPPRKKRSFMPQSITATDPVPDNTIIVYTDGASSGNPGPSGIGIVLKFGPHEREISESIGTATNNIAELSAILRALSEIKQRDLPVWLYTDSSYAIGLLTRGWKAQTNQTLINDIRKLMETFTDLKIIKVKGHDGNEGNERADKLATKGAKKA